MNGRFAILFVFLSVSTLFSMAQATGSVYSLSECFSVVSRNHLNCLEPGRSSGNGSPVRLQQESFYNYRISSGTEDWEGLKQDTVDFLYLQLVGLTVLYFMPEGFSNWGEEEKSRKDLITEKWWDNVQRPAWDKDDWYINYVLHPYWGAAYHVRARHRGYDRSASIWFSATLSALFEFGGEAIFEEPSVQDLITTPLGAYFFGDYLYNWRVKTLEQYDSPEQIPAGDKFLLVLSDPLGAFYYQKDRLFNAFTDVQLQPFYAVPRYYSAGPAAEVLTEQEPVIGMQLSFRW